jgi:hypothetical protein
MYREIIDEIMVTELVKKFLAFYRVWKFITAFEIAGNWSDESSPHRQTEFEIHLMLHSRLSNVIFFLLFFDWHFLF